MRRIEDAAGEALSYDVMDESLPFVGGLARFEIPQLGGDEV
jgi:hypothetical protein